MPLWAMESKKWIDGMGWDGMGWPSKVDGLLYKNTFGANSNIYLQKIVVFTLPVDDFRL